MLSHPNVVKMYDVIEDEKDELTILVMEFIAGGDMFELIIKNQRLSEVRAGMCNVCCRFLKVPRSAHVPPNGGHYRVLPHPYDHPPRLEAGEHHAGRE